MSNECSRKSKLPVLLGAAIALTLGTVAPQGQANNHQQVTRIPFKEVRLIIEFNASAEDIGVQFFLDSDGWEEVQIFSPRGRPIFEAEATANLLRQGGGTELFVESVEPTLEDLPLEQFFRQFPEGRYRFAGTTPEGDRLFGSAEFSHDIPAGPDIIMPASTPDECAEGVPLPVVIAWNEVTTSIDDEPIEVVEYQVLAGDVIDALTTGTTLTIPDGLLKPGTSYNFEVLAIADNGNQTITEGCFVTAD